jgi:dimethylglycine dehydrogenase
MISDVTSQWGVFAIAGPKSRDVLRETADPRRRPGNGAVEQAVPVAVGAQYRAGMCPVTAVRVAYTGELGWELHHPIEMQNYLWDRLMAAGEAHGLKLVGARAQNWLRQEKSYRAFGTELGRDATPLEAGLDRFVDLGKAFHGKAAMLETGIRSNASPC